MCPLSAKDQPNPEDFVDVMPATWKHWRVNAKTADPGSLVVDLSAGTTIGTQIGPRIDSENLSEHFALIMYKLSVQCLVA